MPAVLIMITTAFLAKLTKFLTCILGVGSLGIGAAAIPGCPKTPCDEGSDLSLRGLQTHRSQTCHDCFAALATTGKPKKFFPGAV